MTAHDDFDRTLTAWFEAEALSPAPAHALERALVVVRRRRPRPAWLAGPGSHWVGDEGAGSSPRLDAHLPPVVRWTPAVIVVLIVVALVAGAIVVGAQLLQRSSVPTNPEEELAYGLNGGIYLSDWDGKNPVRILDGAAVGPASCNIAAGVGLRWSPDGKHLAYRSASGDRCAGTVVIIDPQTKDVASFPGDGWTISWSPDSTRVATWLDVFSTIGVYGVGGERQAVLTVPPGCAGGGDYDPVWSPDGTSLYGRGCDVPIDGRTPQRVLATDPRSHQNLAYSPDGARVAYPTVDSLIVAAADGSADRVLVPTGVAPGGFEPMWSPTRDQIAFTGAPEPIGPDGVLPDAISVVDVASGTVTPLARTSGTETVQLIGFSADGDRILFSKTDAYGDGSLWSVRVDGSDSQLLVAGPDWGDWQPRLPSP